MRTLSTLLFGEHLYSFFLDRKRFEAHLPPSLLLRVSSGLRETWEEVGIDLAEQTWLNIGQLDDREITTSLGKRLLMVLSPFGTSSSSSSPFAPPFLD